MKRIHLPLLLAVLSSFVAIEAVAQCATGPGFSAEYRTLPNGERDLIGNFNDYGRIHYDADDPNCAEKAQWALYHKLRKHMWLDEARTIRRPGAFSSWLDGYFVALIYAAALRAGAYGWANRDLDQLLLTQPGKHDGLDRFFAHGSDPNNPCAYGTFNTCMDDNTGTAAGYAWMAAYKERRMRDPDTIALAETHMRQAFNDVCIWDKNPAADGSLCITDRALGLDMLENGTAETLSLNRGQVIHYGFGLMTSIGSAVLGLRAAGSNFIFGRSETLVANALAVEAQKHVIATRNAQFAADYDTDCFSGRTVGGVYTRDGLCHGDGRYYPTMVRLDVFYASAGFVIPDPPLVPPDPLKPREYLSNFFDPFKFPLVEGVEHSYGRLVTYRDHGWRWFEGMPDLMPHDRFDPMGYLESISPTGLAQGWACDRDTNEILDSTNRGIWLDFYAEGDPFNPVAQGMANLPSEDEINGPEHCQGGTMHRFQVQLLVPPQGKRIHAFALDYTWYGHAELECLGNCVW